MQSFDILDDPWIKVVYTDGTHKTLSVIDCLSDATSIKRIECPGNIYVETFAIYRFLIALFVDAYDIHSIEDIEDVYGEYKEGIDLDVLKKYRNRCESEGVSFDIFDDDRPFMQTPKSEEPKKLEVKPVSVLGYGFKSGNSDLFYGLNRHKLVDGAENLKKYEDAQVMSIEEYIAMILTIHFCAVASGTGRSGAVSNVGSPPLWLLSVGETLYDTLFLSMCPKGNDDDIPMWRRKHYLNVISSVSGWLSLAYYPVRYIAPAEGFDGKNVYKVKFDRIQFSQLNNGVLHPSGLTPVWQKYDPHIVLYKYKDAENESKSYECPMRYDKSLDIWLHTHELYGCSYDKGKETRQVITVSPRFMLTTEMLRQQYGVNSWQSIYVLVLGTQTVKDPCQRLYEHFAKTANWMCNVEDKEKIRYFIEFVNSSVGAFVKRFSDKDIAGSGISAYKKRLYDEFGQYFLNDFLKNVEKINIEHCCKSVVIPKILYVARSVSCVDVVKKYEAVKVLQRILFKLAEDKYKEGGGVGEK